LISGELRGRDSGDINYGKKEGDREVTVALAEGQRSSLWRDRKFQWLAFSVALVMVFEFLSLAGWHLPTGIDAPFFAVIIIVIGWRTILHGLKALARLNFRSIKLLMVIAVAGASTLASMKRRRSSSFSPRQSPSPARNPPSARHDQFRNKEYAKLRFELLR
jgi:hypothetical protein